MNYSITARNDRRRRRKARMITALITLTLAALTAYACGAFDAFLKTGLSEVEGVVAGV